MLRHITTIFIYDTSSSTLPFKKYLQTRSYQLTYVKCVSIDASKFGQEIPAVVYLLFTLKHNIHLNNQS